MDDTRVGKKLDEIGKDIVEIKVELGKQHVTLVDHTRRSLANEQAIDLLRSELKPVQKHVDMVNNFFKFIGMVAFILGLALTIKELFL